VPPVVAVADPPESFGTASSGRTVDAVPDWYSPGDPCGRSVPHALVTISPRTTADTSCARRTFRDVGRIGVPRLDIMASPFWEEETPAGVLIPRPPSAVAARGS